jgi:hypothetical protein
MHSYPLKFKTGAIPAEEPLRVLDAEKNEILFRHKLTQAMEEGKSPCIIYSDKTSNQPLSSVLFQKNDERECYMIKTPGNVTLGKLVVEPKHSWKVMDEHDKLVATILERGSWKESCLGMLLTLPMTDDWFWMKIFSPHTFFILMNGKKVLTLRELATVNDDYKLSKHSEFSEREEALLLVGLMMVI